MQYCTKCRRLNEDKVTTCKNCKRSRALRPVKDDDPVFFMTCHAFEADEIDALFEEHGISHNVEQVQLGMTKSPYDVRTLEDDQNIYVNYSELESANEVLLNYDNEKKADVPEDTMPQNKRIAVEIISIIAFMVLVALVVFASDFVANGIKSWLSGLGS